MNINICLSNCLPKDSLNCCLVTPGVWAKLGKLLLGMLWLYRLVCIWPQTSIYSRKDFSSTFHFCSFHQRQCLSASLYLFLMDKELFIPWQMAAFRDELGGEIGGNFIREVFSCSAPFTQAPPSFPYAPKPVYNSSLRAPRHHIPASHQPRELKSGFLQQSMWHTTCMLRDRIHLTLLLLLLSRWVVSTLCDPWSGARQAPLPVGFSRQEYWRRLPFPFAGYLPNPGTKPKSPALASGF